MGNFRTLSSVTDHWLKPVACLVSFRTLLRAIQKLKVIILARDEQDTDYPQRILQGGKGILLYEPVKKKRALLSRTRIFDPRRERA